MAARLTVVVSQASAHDRQSADLEETLVAELMMTPGLDATMVGPLERVQTDGTDFLCLDSFKHSFAFVSWLPCSEVAQHWNRLNLFGSVISVEDAKRLPIDGKNRIYHFQLTPGIQIPTIVSELKQLLQARNVRTVNIVLPGASTAPARSVKPNEPRIPNQSLAPKNTLENNPSRATSSDSNEEIEEWPDLDRLVDDLESLNL